MQLIKYVFFAIVIITIIIIIIITHMYYVYIYVCILLSAYVGLCITYKNMHAMNNHVIMHKYVFRFPDS